MSISKKQGFTLIEFMIVVLIISILSGILMTALIQAKGTAQKKARKVIKKSRHIKKASGNLNKKHLKKLEEISKEK